MITGILFGLTAAALQSLSYLCSSLFLRRTGHPPWVLLAVAHVMMGLAGILLLPAVYPPGFQWDGAVLGGLAGACGFYLFGQMGLFRALRYMDASRVAPLLGAKIMFLALVTALAGAAPPAGRQWLAVLLASAGVFVLNRAGGRMPWRGLLMVALAIVGYSFSDLSIVRLVHATRLDNWHGALFSAIASYIVCGLVMAPFLWRHPACRRPAVWRAALPFAVCWLLSMIFLYACFATIGAVFGNIVQSTRGLISIGLGVLLARLGWTDIERRAGGAVVAARIVGALAMTMAIALYVR